MGLRHTGKTFLVMFLNLTLRKGNISFSAKKVIVINKVIAGVKESGQNKKDRGGKQIYHKS